MLPQLWDGFIWLTPGYGNLSLNHPPFPTSPCWKQLNHPKDNQPNNTRKLDWMSYENCQCTISLKDSDCYGTDWSICPEVYWLAPNGTQWLCVSHLWPWLLLGWLGRCTLGFPWAQDYLCTNLDVFPGTKRFVFYWYDRLIYIFVPSLVLENIISHIEVLTKFTQKALNESKQAISLLNSEISTMRKAVLQNCMALDILRASQEGTRAIIQTEYCVYIPDESSNGLCFRKMVWFWKLMA